MCQRATPRSGAHDHAVSHLPLAACLPLRQQPQRQQQPQRFPPSQRHIAWEAAARALSAMAMAMAQYIQRHVHNMHILGSQLATSSGADASVALEARKETRRRSSASSTSG